MYIPGKKLEKLLELEKKTSLLNYFCNFVINPIKEI